MDIFQIFNIVFCIGINNLISKITCRSSFCINSEITDEDFKNTKFTKYIPESREKNLAENFIETKQNDLSQQSLSHENEIFKIDNSCNNYIEFPIVHFQNLMEMNITKLTFPKEMDIECLNDISYLYDLYLNFDFKKNLNDTPSHHEINLDAIDIIEYSTKCQDTISHVDVHNNSSNIDTNELINSGQHASLSDPLDGFEYYTYPHDFEYAKFDADEFQEFLYNSTLVSEQICSDDKFSNFDTTYHHLKSKNHDASIDKTQDLEFVFSKHKKRQKLDLANVSNEIANKSKENIAKQSSILFINKDDSIYSEKEQEKNDVIEVCEMINEVEQSESDQKTRTQKKSIQKMMDYLSDHMEFCEPLHQYFETSQSNLDDTLNINTFFNIVQNQRISTFEKILQPNSKIFIHKCRPNYANLLNRGFCIFCINHKCLASSPESVSTKNDYEKDIKGMIVYANGDYLMIENVITFLFEIQQLTETLQKTDFISFQEIFMIHQRSLIEILNILMRHKIRLSVSSKCKILSPLFHIFKCTHFKPKIILIPEFFSLLFLLIDKGVGSKSFM